MVVLDAAALLVYVRGEAGGEEIAVQIEAAGAAMSSVSFLEALRQLEGVSVSRLAGICSRVGIRLHDLTARHFNGAATSLRAGMALEPAVAVALARALNGQVLSGVKKLALIASNPSAMPARAAVVETVGGNHAQQNL